MDATLTDRWLDGLPAPIAMLDEASLTLARERIRTVALAQSFDREAVETLALVATEVGRNQLIHSRLGRLSVQPIERDGVPGVELVAADRGEGLADPATAFAGTPRTAGSLGVGLASVRGAAHELDVDVRLGAGTCIRVRTFARPVRRGREVGLLVRAARGEVTSGDDAVVVRSPGGLRVVVADGLGHGAAARADAASTVEALSGEGSPDAVLAELHGALGRRRGSAVAVVEIDEATRSARMVGVGNVDVLRVHLQGVSRFTGEPGALGITGQRLRLRPQAFPFEPRDLLVVHTDGLTSRTTLDARAASSREHPVVVAQRLLASFGRDHDDATVLVVA